MNHFRLLAWSLTVVGCHGAAGADQQQRVADEMKELVEVQLEAWQRASAALASSAPENAWREAQQPQIEAMRQHWFVARHAYELIEGVVAPIFPESDVATDARYDDFLSKLGPRGDSDAFDGEGVIGMHAIERILWADAIPAEVQRFEQALPGYRPAAFPGTDEQARAFKQGLAQRLVEDIRGLRRQFEPLTLDIAFAFRGLIDLAVEQAEKVTLAATGREESRYAQTTMRDLRANYQGCRDAYEVFRPWLWSRDGGNAADAAVLAAFERLQVVYGAVRGDAIPRPPKTWSSLSPSPADRETPFGQLFLAVATECDAEHDGSLHHSLLRAAEALSLPEQVTR